MNRQLVSLAPSLKEATIPETASAIIPDRASRSFVLASNTLLQQFEFSSRHLLTSSLEGNPLSQLKVALESPVCWDFIDGGKFLLADANGQISLLFLAARLSLTSLGHVDALLAVHYLDNRVCFAASYSGPSRLLRIQQNCLDVIAEYPNPGPIIDIVPVPNETGAEIQIVGASGYDHVWCSGRGFWLDECHDRRAQRRRVPPVQ